LQDLISALTIKLNTIDANDTSQSATITTLQSTLKTLQSTVNTVAANKTFSSPLTITSKGKQDEMLYVALQAYVSTYNEKTAANDVTAYRIAIRDKNNEDKASFTFYSNGNRSITVGDTFYYQPFIQRGSATITPTTTTTDTVGTVKISGKEYDVTNSYYEKNNYTVTFARAYSTAPTVVVTPSSTTGHNLHVSVTDVTNTGFKICVERTTKVATVVNWIAAGVL
jgi:hypothetical protein